MTGRSGGLGAAFAAVPPSPDGLGSRILDFVRGAAEDLASLPELDRIVFSTVESARKGGCRVCRKCQPTDPTPE